MPFARSASIRVPPANDHRPFTNSDLKLTSAQLAWFRLRRSGLVQPFSTPAETAQRLIGVQAQMPSAAALAFWNRTAKCTPASLERARLERRQLVRFWGQRNTVHMYRSADWPFLHAAFAESRSIMRKRLEKTGLYPEFRRLVTRIGKRLAAEESLTYKDVRSKKLEEDQDKWVVSYVVFMELVRDGIACHGPDRGNQSTFVHRERWLPKLDWSPPRPAEASAELAVRYLSAYGPAEPRDLAFWYGTTVTNAKRWIRSAGELCLEIDADGRSLWCSRTDLDDLAAKPPPRSRWPLRLLPRFDPLVLATKDKSWLIDEEHYKEVWRPAAHVEAVLLHRGRIAGTWRYERKPRGLVVRLRPFASLGRSAIRAAEVQSTAIAGFLGLALEDFDASRPSHSAGPGPRKL